MMAPRLPQLVLSDSERETLTRWARRRKSSQALALRCRIVMACADGKTNTAVAKELKVTNPTVGKWRKRFVANRLDGLMVTPADCDRFQRHLLESARRLADESSPYVVKQYRSSEKNLRTRLNRIVTDAGLKPWPKPFVNLRASCRTELQ